jgi:superfamily II DNA/RNA helicase
VLILPLFLFQNVQVIVFFPTARAAQFHAALARASGCSCYDLHSRLSQKQRDTAAAAFGSNPTGVIFASDVIARGLDFPDVSLVVQVGDNGMCDSDIVHRWYWYPTTNQCYIRLCTLISCFWTSQVCRWWCRWV